MGLGNELLQCNFCLKSDSLCKYCMGKMYINQIIDVCETKYNNLEEINNNCANIQTPLIFEMELD